MAPMSHDFTPELRRQACSGFVLLNSAWHPWWRATVDGRPAEVLKANVLFRAVIVPPGKHTVRFTFHPFAGASAELKTMLSGLRH